MFFYTLLRCVSFDDDSGKLEVVALYHLLRIIEFGCYIHIINIYIPLRMG
jgi:hypothetical protein